MHAINILFCGHQESRTNCGTIRGWCAVNILNIIE